MQYNGITPNMKLDLHNWCLIVTGLRIQSTKMEFSVKVMTFSITDWLDCQGCITEGAQQTSGLWGAPFTAWCSGDAHLWATRFLLFPTRLEPLFTNSRDACMY